MILSNGDAAAGTSSSNTVPDLTGRSADTPEVPGSDVDMQGLLAAAGYSAQPLFDETQLSFDVVPTISGNLAFQYVFGSEEYSLWTPSELSFPAFSYQATEPL